MFWLSSRYYSPELCRFISPDSVDYLDPKSINGLNLYCYCMNNPIMYADPSGHVPEWLDWNWEQVKRGLIALGVAVVTVATIAVITVASGGSAVPILVGAAIGAGVSLGVSAGAQYLTTGSINVGQLLTDMSVGTVSGAFGGTALGHLGMFVSGFGTGFAGSVAGDLVKYGSFEDINLGAAIWSGLLGGALSGITTGAQNKQFADISKFSNRIKICKGKSINNNYFTHAIKKYDILIKSANLAVIKSIPMTLGTTIIDYYL